jgi:PAS domain S-box-containing protein
VTAKDDEDTLLRSVALQNATSILIARQRAEQRSEFYLAEGQRLSRTGSFGWRPSTGELFWSEETFRIFQYDPATKPTVERVLQRVHPEDAALVQEAIESAAQKGRNFDFEHRLLMPDRSVRHVHVVARASRDESGALEFAGAVMDVTEQHEAREALERALGEIRSSEKLLAGEKRLLEMIARGESRALVLDALCRLVEELARGSLCSILLLDPKTGQLRHGAAPGLPTTYSEAIDGAVIGPAVGSCGTAAYRAEPVIVADIATDPLWANFRDLALAHGLRACWSTPIVSSAGEILGTFATYYREPRRPTAEERNVIDRFTQVASIALERERAEEALRQQARLLDLTHDTVFVRDMNDVITYWNRGAEELYGWGSAAAVGKVTHQLLQTTFPEPPEKITDALLRGGRWEGELVHTRRDGTRVTVASRWAVRQDDEGRPVAILETNNDVTDRKQAEYLTQHVFESSPDSMAILGRDYRLQRVNPVCAERWAMPAESLVGRHIRDVTGTDIFETARPYVDRCFHGEDASFARWLAMPQGRRHVVVTFSPLRPQSERVEAALMISRDITEQALASEALGEAQVQLAHVTRVTTLGEVTASLAHEVNQPLAAIVNNANACLGFLPGGRDLDEVREALADIVKDGERANAIIERVRGLAKRSTPQSVPLRLADVVADVVALTAAESATRGVAIRTDLGPDVPVVLGDRVQLQQVLLNLVVNGMDAMSAVAEGERLLEIRGRLYASQESPPAALLSVRDRGVGLAEGQVDSVFEAFYTTKPHGMGMGLAISRSIIEAHGGRLWVEPGPGPGATFAFSLPAAEATLEVPLPPVSPK